MSASSADTTIPLTNENDEFLVANVMNATATSLLEETLDSPCYVPQRKRNLGRRLVKKIRACGKDWEKALEWFEQERPQFSKKNNKRDEVEYANAMEAVLFSMGRAGALEELKAFYKEQCRRNPTFERNLSRALLSAAGECHALDMVLHTWEIFKEKFQPLHIGDYHLVMNACTKSGAPLDHILALLHEMEQPDVVAFMTAAKACSKHSNQEEAVRLLDCMKQHNVTPNIQLYNRVLMCCSNSNVALKVLREIPDQTKMSVGTVMRICVREKRWKEVSILQQQLAELNKADDSKKKRKFDEISENNEEEEKKYAKYQEQLKTLEKIGKGKTSWRRVGVLSLQRPPPASNLTSIHLGIQSHRNPAVNGLSVVFMNGNEKLGYMLIRNRREEGSLKSSLLGLFLDRNCRGMGLSTQCIAMWLFLCRKLNVIPEAEKINKPLLSLALKKFGFEPRPGGVQLEISPLTTQAQGNAHHVPTVQVYSPERKILSGVFTERALRGQDLVISTTPPNPRGKVVWVGIGFTHPCCHDGKKAEELQDQLNKILGLDRFSLSADIDTLQNALFGFLMI